MWRASGRATKKTKSKDIQSMHIAPDAGLAPLLQPECGVFPVDGYARNAKYVRFQRPVNSLEDEKLTKDCA
ncbi:hypothetical protein NDU88_005287 [Pleurodeles waltl]|uniref:Uncharacterized protein n=1 Tax=Pleurodeles waltl TaxID=8319 RepID=A0AAV7N5D6_PLEWA|nr:hypothetical protein NDU88_005287 [Pleurodeles waltl]